MTESMDILNIKKQPIGIMRLGVGAGILSALLLSQQAIADEDDENSLANRLKEFNQPAITVSVTKAKTKAKLQKTSVRKPSRKRSKRLSRACYQSSAASIKRHAKRYQSAIQANSRRYNVDKNLIIAVITAESCFAEKARSHAGAQGLMQLIPATAKRFGVKNVYKPSQNIRGGTRYLRFLMKRFSGNMKYAVAAYNAGEGAVDRYSGIPPYRETKEYVRRVMAVYHRLQGTSPKRGVMKEKRAKVMQAKYSNRSKPQGYFVKPDYKWHKKTVVKKSRRARTTRVSRAYPIASVKRSSGRCRDVSEKRLKRSTSLFKRTRLWQRHFIVKRPTSLASIARATGVPVHVLMRLNRGISRFRVNAGQRVLAWQCSKR